MAGNISSGDFGCCGSWAHGCAVDKGCVYHDLLYAMDHCNVFKKFYIEKDETFIKSWKDGVNNIGKPKRRVRLNRQEDPKVVDALAEAMALLAKLGL